MNNLNAAAKARRAEEESRRQQMEQNNKEKRYIKERAFFFILLFLPLVLGIFSFVFQIIGYNVYSTGILIISKIFFYVGIGAFVLGAIFMIVGGTQAGYSLDYDESAAILWVNGIAMAALLVISIITLAKGILKYDGYYVAKDDGVVYVKYDYNYTPIDSLDGARTIVIRSEINGYDVIKIKNYTFKGNKELKEVHFEGGDLEIGSYAFENCTNLEYVIFDAYDYSLGESVFNKCNIKEINIGKANVTVSDESYGYMAKNPKTKYIINGGTLICGDEIGYAIIGKDSSFIINHNDGEDRKNGTYVFLEGFDFTDKTTITTYEEAYAFDKGYQKSVAKTIYIPVSVTKIPENFFVNGKTKVYYAGSQEQWNNIVISSNGNDAYTNGDVEVIFNTPYTE